MGITFRNLTLRRSWTVTDGRGVVTASGVFLAAVKIIGLLVRRPGGGGGGGGGGGNDGAEFKTDFFPSIMMSL